MNSPRKKVLLFTRFLFALLAFIVTIGLLMKTASNSVGARGYQVTITQDDEKSLNIERYPNEPLELVDIRVRDISVKDKIKTKLKDGRNRPVLDHVGFKEGDDWFKHVKIRVRNVSNRSICGLDVNLYFQPTGVQMVFKMDLKPKDSRNLYERPLQPGEEIELHINEPSFNEGMRFMTKYGVEATQTNVSMAIHTAYFSDDFGWSKGSYIRRDPYNPNNWNAVEPEGTPTPPARSLSVPSEASQLFRQAGFKTNRLELNSTSAQFLNRCQAGERWNHILGLQLR